MNWNTIRTRLYEPSTWAGLSVLSLICGANPATIAKISQVASAVAPIAPADGGTLAHWVTAAAAGLAVVMGESGGVTAAQAQAPAAAPLAQPAAPQVVYVQQPATQAPAAQAPAAQPLTTG
jgi:hypothetical protein